MSIMKFDFVIGNPPYQESSDDNGRQPPVYHLFMNGAYAISDCVELITPARFLFDAGQTPKEWNRKMLSDRHFKVLKYEADASKVFSNTDIKGGVAITLMNRRKDFGEIGVFTESPVLNSILKKVQPYCSDSLEGICIGAVPYKFSDKFMKERVDCQHLCGDSFDLRTNILDKLFDRIFFRDKVSNVSNVKIYGLHEKNRECLWVNKRYIVGPENFDKYKVLLPKAAGAGKFGESLPQMIIAKPWEGHTQSFISLGGFDSKQEAANLEKYIKTKFCRGLLGVLKITQDITPSKWKYVPNQKFVDGDINWNSSISNIDRQLYKKYNFSQEEIDFIENGVMEMA